MVKLPTPLQKLSHPLLDEKQIGLYVKRDDLTHPEIMGNKWRKLKYNLVEARSEEKIGIVTLGGAYSNHIAATAAACRDFGFKSIGIIRGDELHEQSNPTLQYAASCGMEMDFIDREQYRSLRENPYEVLNNYNDYYFLPEGGTNALAIKGCKEIIDEIDIDFDLMACPIGTGGTFCGLLSASKKDQHIMGLSTLKGDFIDAEIGELVSKFAIGNTNYTVNKEYHFGGYGKTTAELIDFINWFKEYFGLQLDPIYTGKSFFGVWDMIISDKFEKNLEIVLLHTGGLQGIEGFNRKNENIIQ